MRVPQIVCALLSVFTVTAGADDETYYRYVKLENFVVAQDGDDALAGADLDAVGVEINGTTYYATRVLLHGGLRPGSDPTAILGPADSQCQFRKFLNLGPVSGAGFVVLGFDTQAGPLLFSSGARILVFELGPTLCPAEHNWRDDPVVVSVSADLKPESFEILGATGPGQNIVVIP